MAWECDESLELMLREKVNQNYSRKELLSYVNRDFPHLFKHGTCSLRTLCRVLSHFNIKYVDNSAGANEVLDAVKYETSGPGKDLGYRALTAKIREEHNLNVPRDAVYAAMQMVDPEALEARQLGAKKKARTGHFVTEGPNSYWSVDGHDKMCGYQHEVPLGIYGILDQASRKILMLKVGYSNKDPNAIGHWFVELLYNLKIIPKNLRMDKGTETGVMAAIFSQLRFGKGGIDDPTDCLHYGPSTSNQVNLWN